MRRADARSEGGVVFGRLWLCSLGLLFRRIWRRRRRRLVWRRNGLDFLVGELRVMRETFCVERYEDVESDVSCVDLSVAGIDVYYHEYCLFESCGV